MSAENIDNPISYEQLEDLEDDFEQVELELRKFYLCYCSIQASPLLFVYSGGELLRMLHSVFSCWNRAIRK